MKIKFDFWVTPDGYNGANTEHTGKAHHVKGAVDVPVASMIAAMAVVIGPRSMGHSGSVEVAAAMLRDAVKEAASG